MNSKKTKATAPHSNKENINPNILLNLGEKVAESPDISMQNYQKQSPNVSSFQIFNEVKNWKQKVLQPSEK